jgi:hypothetical protein
MIAFLRRSRFPRAHPQVSGNTPRRLLPKRSSITELIAEVCPFPLIPPSQPHESPRTEHAIRQIAQWLEQCSGHSHCNAEKITSPPARLLEISDAGFQNELSVRLINAESHHTPYVCLSHRWGNVTFIQTTRANLAEFKQHIPWRDLTKTFQEAMIITHGLGIRYIWIDSLCVCQDDAADWAREGSNMDSIGKKL